MAPPLLESEFMMSKSLLLSVSATCGVAALSSLVACASGDADEREAGKTPYSATIVSPEGEGGDTIIPFEGAGGPTGVGRSPGSDRLAPMPNMAERIGSNCSQSFPPPASLPCVVPEAGRVYYVSATSGNDVTNDGTKPDRAWATLFHAVRSAEEKSTIKVAAGDYASAEVFVDRALVIKGGFDVTFGSWDPDRHVTSFYGQLSLAHDHAIWGGFHIINRTVADPAAAGGIQAGRVIRHVVSGGTLVRNYVEVLHQAGGNQFALDGIVAASPEGHRTRLYCNDVYVRGQGVSPSTPSLDVRAIGYDDHAGEARLASNRVCVDRSRGILAAAAASGSASSSAAPTHAHASVVMTNNLLEVHGDEAPGIRMVHGVRFSGGARDLDVVATNNTIFSELDGIAGNPNSVGGKMRWTMTNNVVFSKAGRHGVSVGPKGSGLVEIPESSGNLIFGFTQNAISPVPRTSTNDDTTNTWTMREVVGDAFLPKENGPARMGGVNVFGKAEYGAVRTDLFRSTRPVSGVWSRGALQ
jgi:hypothetical protein